MFKARRSFVFFAPKPRGQANSGYGQQSSLLGDLKVEIPKIEPKLTEPFLGFTNTAEIWNSRACMIGLVGTFLVELIFHKGILQIIGVDVGKGLNLPL
ncbi:light-harvesting complex-like protein OHP1, chloroplastic isoform X2 [Dendrobium catenatum]|uniref:light-harvesting complex-like protein OHP1, chloroplastic isoform X2 n=1 Tax=Dendrobium catenatum TaxID=906689 RepID=UPI0009F3B1EF|nr:light-harvesting complex-like protein OHP1, chloroplastic isoform X2 [Dendrobium catenatum]